MAAPARGSSSIETAWVLLKRLHWTRGLRAGVAVAGAMLVCHILGKPMGWAALGGFEAILVDNGGPYRSRLETIATLLVGGSIACIAGALVGDMQWVSIVVTAAFCFAGTFARVASERIASTSVIILVLYFAGVGGSSHTLAYALSAAVQFMLGGMWAALLSLIFWPVDPFRPARTAVAECYRVLAEFTAQIPSATIGEDEGQQSALNREQTSQFQREMRVQMELARVALGTTAARVTARTVRARSLAVLLETADMLFALTLRSRELAEIDADPAAIPVLKENAVWLSAAERAIHTGLQRRPKDNAASYLADGSPSLQHVHSRVHEMQRPVREGKIFAHLAADERDALESIEIAFEAVRAIWSGLDLHAGSSSGAVARWKLLEQSLEGFGAATSAASNPGRWTNRWTEALRSNWTFTSVMMRHAVRMALVGGVDIVLMRLTHVRHGYWLAMTSIIVLQPYGSGTLRRGWQRVGGTIAGGLLAAVLATVIHTRVELIAVVSIVSTFTLATYAVNYAWYCFFLTPTFVLMAMPYFRDWKFAQFRMINTVLGALVAVLAMRLLWPEREHIALSRLLGRGASADANYLCAMLQFWEAGPSARVRSERQVLAPARRLSGLAINDAEESLDRMMLEPGFGRRASSGDIQAEALVFVTYLRRLLRAATTMTVVGAGGRGTIDRVSRLIVRLETIAGTMIAGNATKETSVFAQSNVPVDGSDMQHAGSIEDEQMRRMERQVGVLERTAIALLGKSVH